jgi:hypothetical protein
MDNLTDCLLPSLGLVLFEDGLQELRKGVFEVVLQQTVLLLS